MANTDPNAPMSLNDMRTVLMFFMSKLSPADLEELDAQLLDGVQPIASDSRFGDPTNRGKLLRLGAQVRRAARQINQAQDARIAADRRSFEEMFPNLHRLKG